MNEAIRVENVSVHYGEVHALDHVDLTLNSGSVCGLIGMNGSGKSTLFKVIMGMIKPDNGSVRIAGLGAATARKSGRVGYVPQSEDVDWTFPISVRDVVMMGRYGHLGFLRRPRRADREAVAEALERVELTEFADRQIGQLSGGQKKRAFVARGIAQDASILLLDEPFAGVDKRSEATISMLLRELASDGRSILVSTHDLHAVPKLCDEAVLLMRKVLVHSDPDTVLQPENLALAFGLDYGFMVRALAVAVVAAIVCAVLSCWLVLIGWSLMGDAVSHAVLPGVVLAYVVGAPFAIGALIFGLIAVALIGLIRNTSRVKEDAAIGIVFTTLFAFGLVLISVTPSQTDLNHIIFGNLLGVSSSDLLQVAILGALALSILLIKRRDLTLFAFDPIHANAIGLSPKRLGALLLGVLALTSVVALQAVGVVLVVAMLIIPGATAYLLTDKFSRMLVIAPVVSAVCAIAGIYVSYYLDTASGGMVVMTQGIVFALVYLFSPSQGVIAKWTSQQRRTRAEYSAAGRTSLPDRSSS
eukprot:gene23506-28173_t